MDKQLVLFRLKQTLAMAEQIKPEEFKFDSWISDHTINESGTTCATVACIGGWYPRYFPEAGLSWNDGDLITTPGKENNYRTVAQVLSDWHGLGVDLINAMFGGHVYSRVNADSGFASNVAKLQTQLRITYHLSTRDVTLKDVKEMFSAVYHYVETGIIPIKED